MAALAVAALSARSLAEQASAEGFDVVALDLFGDVDTLRASSSWIPIGRPGTMRIDEDLMLAALCKLSQRGDVAGWIPGSGLEGQPDVLQRGAALLPLIGTGHEAVRRVRDPDAFFGFLDREGIAHPPVQRGLPVDMSGWLIKDFSGCGGWHIRRAGALGESGLQPSDCTHRYYQREMPGLPMSVTYIANGNDTQVLGFNQLIVRSVGARPYVFCGVIGPVPLPSAAADRIVADLRKLVRAFGLRGLGSLDVIVDGGTIMALEVNPRPPASMALYGARPGQRAGRGARTGIVSRHLRACLHDELTPWTMPPPGGIVNGSEIVFAPRPLRLDAAAARRLAGLAGCHDLPAEATRFETDDPLCSVTGSGADTGQVRVQLDLGREAVLACLETVP